MTDPFDEIEAGLAEADAGPKLLTPQEKQAKLDAHKQMAYDRAVRVLLRRAAAAIEEADGLRITVSLSPGRGPRFPPSAIEAVRKHLTELGWHVGLGPEGDGEGNVDVVMLLTPLKNPSAPVLTTGRKPWRSR